ncbi:MAG: deoxyribose-phosphate aldolase [Bacteroidales bacterium]|jgi:deoxyribose-phosphate aldolase|nr:deoxyribose-phosphate aldolase [Bacteroidales bacterium]
MNLFSKYGYTPNKEAIDSSLGIIASNLDGVISDDVLKDCFSFMDLTSLHSNDTRDNIIKLVGKVNAFKTDFPDYPLPASICVYPNFASVIKSHRNYPDVRVTVVSGCFPSSQSFLEVKVKECEMAVSAGAEEVDIVLSLNSFLCGDYAAASNEISEIRKVIDATAASQGRSAVLKVILETGLLVTPENIANASFLAMEAGADFIKTSTGKVDVNATPVAAYVMCECISKYYEKTGRRVGFKAAGGISTATDAVVYYSIVSTILGKEWLDKKYFRLGVSRLANNLISAIEQKTVTFF